jgi:hypothetical protein
MEMEERKSPAVYRRGDRETNENGIAYDVVGELPEAQVAAFSS